MYDSVTPPIYVRSWFKLEKYEFNAQILICKSDANRLIYGLLAFIGNKNNLKNKVHT